MRTIASLHSVFLAVVSLAILTSPYTTLFYDSKDAPCEFHGDFTMYFHNTPPSHLKNKVWTKHTIPNCFRDQ